MRAKLLAGFLGAAIASAAWASALHSLTVYIKEAKVVSQDQGTCTVQFYHDSTDQVLRVKLPIEIYPSRVGGAYVRKVTVDLWSDLDNEATRLMSDSALNVLPELVKNPAWRIPE